MFNNKDKQGQGRSPDGAVKKSKSWKEKKEDFIQIFTHGKSAPSPPPVTAPPTDRTCDDEFAAILGAIGLSSLAKAKTPTKYGGNQWNHEETNPEKRKEMEKMHAEMGGMMGGPAGMDMHKIGDMNKAMGLYQKMDKETFIQYKQRIQALRDEDLYPIFRRVLAGRGRALKDVRLMVLGQGRVGKTALVNAFQGKEFEPETASTVGVDTFTWEVVPMHKDEQSPWKGWSQVKTEDTKNSLKEALVLNLIEELFKDGENPDASEKSKESSANADKAPVGPSNQKDALQHATPISASSTQGDGSPSKQDEDKSKQDETASQGCSIAHVENDGEEKGDAAAQNNNNKNNNNETEAVASSDTPAVGSGNTDHQQAAKEGGGGNASGHSAGGNREGAKNPEWTDELMTYSNTLGIKQIGKDVIFKHARDGTMTDNMRFNIWDYGGQKVFYSLHHLFLTRNGIYIVVFNMEELLPTADPKVSAKCLEYLRFWLNSIVVHTRDKEGHFARVFLVGTHKDKAPKYEQAAHICRVLTEKFKKHPLWNYVHFWSSECLSFYPIDNTKGQKDCALLDLMHGIEYVAGDDEYIKQKIPFTWYKARDTLDKESDCKMVITRARAAEIASESGMPSSSGVELEEELTEMLLLFHQLGFLMYFDEPALRDTVVLRPAEFLIPPATRVICDRELHGHSMHKEARKMTREWAQLEEKAELAHKLLGVLWSDCQEHAKALERLMVKFGLMVPLLPRSNSRTHHRAPSHGANIPAGNPSNPLSRQSSEDDLRFLVPSMLPASEHDQHLPRVGRRVYYTCFLLFASDDVATDWLEQGFVSQQQASEEGFFPEGIFSRLICKLVGWSQNTDGVRVSLSANEAELTFGDHRFCIEALTQTNSCRVSILVDSTRVVIDRVKGLSRQTLDECMPNLSCLIGIPKDGGMRPEGYNNNYDGTFVVLDKLVGMFNSQRNHDQQRTNVLISPRELVDFDEIMARFSKWLPPKGLMSWYDVFISYRWLPFDSDLAEALFSRLSMEIHVNRGVEVFRDRERLEVGRNFRFDFSTALSVSTVAVPIMSQSALEKMVALKEDSDVDNLLFEWTLIIEFLEASRLRYCVPILVGSPKEDIIPGQALVTCLFESGVLDKLPDVTVRSVVEEVAIFMRSIDMEPSSGLMQRTVKQTIKRLTLNTAVLTWDMGLGYGGSASAMHDKEGFRNYIYRRCTDKVMECVRKTARQQRGSIVAAYMPPGPLESHSSSADMSSGNLSLSPHLNPASDLASNRSMLPMYRTDTAKMMSEAEAEARKVVAEAESIRFKALADAAEAGRMRAESEAARARAESELEIAKIKREAAEELDRVKSSSMTQRDRNGVQSACCVIS